MLDGSGTIDKVCGSSRQSIEAQRQDDNSIWNAVQNPLKVREKHRVFGWGEMEWLGRAYRLVATFVRRLGDHGVIALHNLADAGGAFELPAHGKVRDLLTGMIHKPHEDRLEIKLEPYQYLWLHADQTIGQA